MDHHQIIGLISFIIGIAATFVYIKSILKKETKPHFFTWIIWSILTAISYAAQLHDHAGPGS